MIVLKGRKLYNTVRKLSLEQYAGRNKVYNILRKSRRHKMVFNKRYMRMVRHIIFKNRFIYSKPGSDFSMYNRLNYSPMNNPGNVQINRVFSMRMIKRKRVGNWIGKHEELE